MFTWNCILSWLSLTTIAFPASFNCQFISLPPSSAPHLCIAPVYLIIPRQNSVFSMPPTALNSASDCRKMQECSVVEEKLILLYSESLAEVKRLNFFFALLSYTDLKRAQSMNFSFHLQDYHKSKNNLIIWSNNAVCQNGHLIEVCMKQMQCILNVIKTFIFHAWTCRYDVSLLVAPCNKHSCLSYICLGKNKENGPAKCQQILVLIHIFLTYLSVFHILLVKIFLGGRIYITEL